MGGGAARQSVVAGRGSPRPSMAKAASQRGARQSLAATRASMAMNRGARSSVAVKSGRASMAQSGRSSPSGRGFMKLASSMDVNMTALREEHYGVSESGD